MEAAERFEQTNARVKSRPCAVEIRPGSNPPSIDRELALHAAAVPTRRPATCTGRAVSGKRIGRCSRCYHTFEPDLELLCAH